MLVVLNCYGFGYWTEWTDSYRSEYSVSLIGADMFKFEMSVMFISISILGSWVQGSAPLRDLFPIIWRSRASGRDK